MDGFDRHPPPVPAAPVLHLEGFDGPMDLLLDLAERQKIDLGRMSVLALAEQFVDAMARFGDRVPLERRADWLVMATRLVLLRARLLFPATPEVAAAAERDAATEVRRLDGLAGLRAAAAWLGARPVLGQEVFARSAPERLGVWLEADHAVDVIAFLWASMALFEDDADGVETEARYRPAPPALHTVAEARARILRLLADRGEGAEGEALEYFLPKAQATGEGGDTATVRLRRCSAWATTFSAGLDLARQGDVALTQAEVFGPIKVCPNAARA
jgi:segregation and condensation protein A